MAKIASTVNLEEYIWKEIDEYMQKNKVNRNTAIEFMLIERRMLLKKFANNKMVLEEKQTISNDEFTNNFLIF